MRIFLLVLCFCGWGWSAYADNQSTPGASVYRQELSKTIVEEEEFFAQNLDTYARCLPYSGADAQSGKVGIIDTATEYSYTIKALDKIPVEFGLATRYIGIKNTTAVELPKYLTSFTFGTETTLPFFNFKYTYFTLGLAVRFNGDNWNINHDTLSLNQRYFFIYQPNKQLTFIGGLSVAPGDRDTFTPIVGFIYRPLDRLTFSIIPAQPEIAYGLTEKLTAFAQANISRDEYAVNKGGLKNIVLEYNEIHAGVGLRCAFNKYVQGSISGGGVFNRLIKYRNDQGKIGLQNGVYSEFRLEVKV